MTDLKTANKQLADALAALDSPEHDADVREAEKCRTRLLELDAKIGARIKAKLDAHRAIADEWRHETAASWVEAEGKQKEGKSPDDLPIRRDELARRIDHALTGTPVVTQSTADAWQAHHDQHAGQYSLSGEDIPFHDYHADRDGDPPVTAMNGVAEMPQSDVSRETSPDA